MFCSTSISVHLLRGALGFALVASALLFTGLGWLGSVAVLAGAVWLLRGCPMCWLMGLFETVRNSRDRTPPAPG